MKYITTFIIILTVSATFLSLSWFTWQAWIGVTCILTMYYWIQESHAENLYNSTLAQTKRLDLVKDRVEKLTELVKRDLSDSDVVKDKILSELRKIRKTVRHEVKDL